MNEQTPPPAKKPRKGRRPETFPVELRDLIAALSDQRSEVRERSYPSESPLTDVLEIHKYLGACRTNGTPEEQERARIFTQTYMCSPTIQDEQTKAGIVTIKPRSDSKFARRLTGLLAEVELELGLAPQGGERAGALYKDSDSAPSASLEAAQAPDAAHLVAALYGSAQTPPAGPAPAPAPFWPSFIPRPEPSPGPFDLPGFVASYRALKIEIGPTRAMQQIHDALVAEGVQNVTEALAEIIAASKSADER